MGEAEEKGKGSGDSGSGGEERAPRGIRMHERRDPAFLVTRLYLGGGGPVAVALLVPTVSYLLWAAYRLNQISQEGGAEEAQVLPIILGAAFFLVLCLVFLGTREYQARFVKRGASLVVEDVPPYAGLDSGTLRKGWWRTLKVEFVEFRGGRYRRGRTMVGLNLLRGEEERLLVGYLYPEDWGKYVDGARELAEFLEAELAVDPSLAS